METAGSRHVLERVLGHPVYFFAYPFGDYNDAVLRAVHAGRLHDGLHDRGRHHREHLGALDHAARPRRKGRDPERAAVAARRGLSPCQGAGRQREHSMIEFADAQVDAGEGRRAGPGDARGDRGASTTGSTSTATPCRARDRPSSARPTERSWSAPPLEGPCAAAGSSGSITRTCEIKKMYVIPAARGRGMARGCCTRSRPRRASSATPSRGWTRAQQPDARGLYESEGYAEIEDFNGNPVAVFWGEKPL